MQKTIWLRHESKPFEKRTALTPSSAAFLRSKGHNVVIERSPSRCFDDEEYFSLGFNLVPKNSWINDAPEDAIILGLKELEDENFPLVHKHIFFAHMYKGQEGSSKSMGRFHKGKGSLYDLEYLVDRNEKRIAAFGIWAGFIGAALGIKVWAAQKKGVSFNSLAPLKPFASSQQLINNVKKDIEGLDIPKILIIGSNGRCGKGATKLINSVGLTSTGWGRTETANGPITDILNFDILINTVLMTQKTEPFLTEETLKEKRNLSVISDVSCDPNGPFNPLPIYTQGTTMDSPIVRINDKEILDITAIDHLPSLLPRESSIDYCEQLLPHLIEFLDGKSTGGPWDRSLELFYEHLINFEDKTNSLQ